MSKKKVVSEACKKLTDYILFNDSEGFFKYLPELEDINEKNGDGVTLIYSAVERGRTDMIKELYRRDANVDIPAKDGYPPFHFAMVTGDIFMVQMLYEMGFNIHSRDQYGNNAISSILFSNNCTAQHIIIYLLRHGVNPDAKNRNGYSARYLGENIANYDYAPLFKMAPAGDTLTERINACQGLFDDVAITSQEVLDGAEITAIRYYDLDRTWDFQTSLKPDAQHVRVSTLSGILKTHPELREIMSKMSVDQYALRDEQGNWNISNITQDMVYDGYW